MNKEQGIELAIVLLSILIYTSYHVWLFGLRAWVHRRFRRKSARRAAVFYASSDARLAWTLLASQDKTDAGVPAVQTLRNSIMAASFMATTCGLMATSGVLQILTDGNRLSMVRKLGDLDPIVNLAGSHGLIRVEWKVGICEFLLLVSLLFFVQAIRLLMYLGYLVKVRACGEPFASAIPLELALAFASRSGHCWSAGVRVWCLFIPVAFLAFTDEVPIKDFSSITKAGEAEEVNGDEPEQGLNLKREEASSKTEDRPRP